VTEEFGPILRSIDQKVTETATLVRTLVEPGGRIPNLEHDMSEMKEFKAKADATVKTTATFWGMISAALGLFGHLIWDAVRGVKH
jgi:hypothetical protein